MEQRPASEERSLALQRFWKDELARLSPFQWSRRQAGDKPGIRGDGVQFPLMSTAMPLVREVAGACSVSPFVLLFSIYANFIRQWCGISDLVFGVPFTSRDTGEFDRTVGNFSSLLPIRAQWDPRASTHSSSKAAAECVSRCMSHKEFPMSKILRDVMRERGGSDVLACTFAYHETTRDWPTTDMIVHGRRSEWFELMKTSIRLRGLRQQAGLAPLALDVIAIEKGLVCDFKYDDAYLDRNEVAALGAAFVAFLLSALRHPHQGTVLQSSRVEVASQ